jgi:NAD(P) transhydrogenase subunit alpha
MKIAIPKERTPGEDRVAATPDSVKRLSALGAAVSLEAGAGAGSSISDQAYASAGATIVADVAALLGDADMVLKVQPPLTGADGEAAKMKPGAILISQLQALTRPDVVEACQQAKITAFALELLPRITRAQSMDVLSSQSNLAGYRAVIEAAAVFGRAFPMMMTAAGTIAPARVLVLGAGVAGLQAIATARRLGAAVTGYDVRAAVKEQVESLGAKFLEVAADALQDDKAAGGYAKEMSAEYKARQAQVLHDAVKKSDIAISTALIPGKPAPRLITADMVKDMRPGSVIVDLAVENGGNCELSERDQVVERHGVKIVGFTNMPGRLAEDASSLYARNLVNFIGLLVDKQDKTIKINWDDEIIKGALVTRDGQAVHPRLAGGTAA